jgi:hypothetical protein
MAQAYPRADDLGRGRLRLLLPPVPRGEPTRRHDLRGDLTEDIARLEVDRMLPVAGNRRPGLGRDLLMVKHIEKLVRLYGRRWRALQPDERRRAFDAGAAVIRCWDTRLIQRALPAWAAIRAYCLLHGLLAELEDVAACRSHAVFANPVIERGRLFARYPLPGPIGHPRQLLRHHRAGQSRGATDASRRR